MTIILGHGAQKQTKYLMTGVRFWKRELARVQLGTEYPRPRQITSQVQTLRQQSQAVWLELRMGSHPYGGGTDKGYSVMWQRASKSPPGPVLSGLVKSKGDLKQRSLQVLNSHGWPSRPQVHSKSQGVGKKTGSRGVRRRKGWVVVKALSRNPASVGADPGIHMGPIA